MSDDINVSALSDEEFDKEFEKMLQTPVEEDGEVGEETPTEEPEAAQEEEILEQPEDEVEAEEEDDLDEDSEPEDETESEDSTDEIEVKDEDVVTPFTFDSIPMNEVLPMDIPVNGTKVRATMNELMTGFKQGMNYTQKMQELAPMRKSLNIMSENELSEEDLNLLVEAKQGNKQALAKLIGDAGVDSLDLDADEAKGYSPSNYGSEPESFVMEQVKNEINADTENLPAVQSALNTMPQSFFDEVSADPQNLKALHADVSSGMYNDVMPEMQKIAALTGRTPSVELYREAVSAIARQQPRGAKASEAVEDPNVTQQRTEKRKAAVSGTKRKSAPKKSVVNFDDLDDTDFEAEFKKMTGRAISDYA